VGFRLGETGYGGYIYEVIEVYGDGEFMTRTWYGFKVAAYHVINGEPRDSFWLTVREQP